MLTAAMIAALLGGVTGSGLTYCLSWLRERRRTLDAYRAPQREAIAGIVVALHELLLRVADFRRDYLDNRGASGDQPLKSLSRLFSAVGGGNDHLRLALIGFDQAQLLGLLTIVDDDCYEALDKVVDAFKELRNAMSRIAGTNPSPEEAKVISSELAELAKRLAVAVTFLLVVGRERVAPVRKVLNKPRSADELREMRKKYMDVELPEHVDNSSA